MSMKELLAVLHDEVVDAAEIMKSALVTWRDAGGEAEAADEARTTYIDQVSRIREVATMLELTGIETLCDAANDNLLALPAALPSAAAELFHAWPRHLIDYLAKPSNRSFAEQLVENAASSDHPVPLEPERRASLLEQLSSPDLGGTDAEASAPKTARSLTEADFSLDFAPDLDEQLIESFMFEAPRHASHYASVINEIARSGAGGISAIDEARRVIHTLKGAANTAGVRAVAVLCHQTEDILDYLVQSAAAPDKALSDLLVRVADCIDAMVSSVLGDEAPPDHRVDVMREVIEVATRIDEGRLTAIAPQPNDEEVYEQPPTGRSLDDHSTPDRAGKADALPGGVDGMIATPPVTGVHDVATTPSDSTQPPQPGATGSQPGPAPRRTSALSLATEQLDRLIDNAGEISITDSRIRNLIGGLAAAIEDLREQNFTLRERANAIEYLVDVQGIGAGRSKSAGAGSDTFDDLELDRYNELHTHTHAFVESFDDFSLLTERLASGLDDVQSTLAEQMRLHEQLQGGLMQSRMVSVKRIGERLQRAVRHTCHQTGKEVGLTLEGESVQVDSYVLNELTEPLIHLVRNAIDHGIEMPAERIALGKEAQGQILVEFAREGEKVVIHCRDDGRGLDVERIRSKALELGLIEGENLSDDALSDIITQPGFSTAGEVTPVSGRGVGMDVVNASVQALKGTLDVVNSPGRGVTVILRLPMTLGIVPAIILDIAGRRVGVPVDDVERVVHGGTSQIRSVGSEWYFHTDGAAVMVRLAGDLLDYPGQTPLPEAEGATRPLVIVRSGAGSRVALVVDQIEDIEDLVLKQPGRYLDQLPGLVGISVLGDGHVVPLINPGRLLVRSASAVSPRQIQVPDLMQRVDGRSIMVVDDSLSVRNSLSQLLSDAGYKVRTAKDGLEAAEAIAADHPAAVLVDLEMPRMNGIELTERLRDQDETRSLPIIMITSRSQEKHRLRAQRAGVDAYLTKPYQELEVLDLLRAHVT